MTETSAAPNNRLVVYRGKRPMPLKSQAQAKAMFAARSGNSTLGIPQSVGEEFTADQAPGSVKALPKRVTKLRKRGAISEKAAAKHLSKYGSENEIDASSR